MMLKELNKDQSISQTAVESTDSSFAFIPVVAD